METDTARLLIRLGCLALSTRPPFTYASGATGPVYCDNRRVLSFPDERSFVIEKLRQALKESSWPYDRIAGLATAGIPHAALLADRLKAPLIYIRPQNKGHGRHNQVEGHYRSGERIVLVEDLVNQGGSLAKAADAAKRVGLVVTGCLCLVDYQTPKARERLAELGVPLRSLTNMGAIVDAAIEQNRLSKDEAELVKKWQEEQK